VHSAHLFWWSRRTATGRFQDPHTPMVMIAFSAGRPLLSDAHPHLTAASISTTLERAEELYRAGDYVAVAALLAPLEEMLEPEPSAVRIAGLCRLKLGDFAASRRRSVSDPNLRLVKTSANTKGGGV
jgi:hypothetical protein